MHAHTHTCVHTHINTHTPPGRALSPGLPDDEHYFQKYLFPVGPVMKTLLRYYFKCADREKGDTGYHPDQRKSRCRVSVRGVRRLLLAGAIREVRVGCGWQGPGCSGGQTFLDPQSTAAFAPMTLLPGVCPDEADQGPSSSRRVQTAPRCPSRQRASRSAALGRNRRQSSEVTSTDRQTDRPGRLPTKQCQR